MSRQQSAIIKGLAILLMMLYHLPCIRTIPGLDDSVFPVLATACHPIQYFLMVSGYGLYVSYKKGRITWPYLLKRSGRLYLSFWLVLLIFVFAIGSILYPGRFNTSPMFALSNLTGLRWDYCLFTWFLLPYVLMTFCSTMVFRAIDRIGIVWSIVAAIFIMLATGWLISRHYFDLMYPYFIHLVYLAVLVVQTFSGLIIGAVMAKVTLSGLKLTCSVLEGRNLLILALLLALFAVRCQIQISVITFFFVIAVVWLVLHLRLPQPVSRVFESLGDKSMMMWFLHGFLAVQMFSEYVALLRWPLLIWVLWVIITYCIASVLMLLSNKLARELRLM